MDNEVNTLLRDFMLYPQMTAAVQRSLDDLERATGVLNRLYSASGSYIMRKITDDLRENRLALNSAGLRITRAAELSGLIHVEFTRKGRAEPEVYAVAHEVLREEMRARMAQYIAAFGSVLGAEEQRK
ncbi:hypothetical protein D3C75_682040 [compost metagenome]